MKKILLTTVGGGNANNLTRALRYNYDIIGTNSNKFELVKAITKKNYLVPRFDSDDYIKCMEKIIEVERIDFLIPNHEFEIKVIVNSNSELLKSKSFLPKKEIVDLCIDKAALINKFEANGFEVTRTIKLNSYSDIESSFLNLMVRSDLPVWCRANEGAGSRGAAPLYSPAETKFWIEYWVNHRGFSVSDFTLSEYLPGADYHSFSIWKDGKKIISKTIKRLEYVCSKYTISGTSSSPSKCILVDNKIVEKLCEDSIKSIDSKANGLFATDLKENVYGQPCITEINIGRFPRINPIFNFTLNNMAEIFVRVALNLDYKIYPMTKEINREFYLLRDFDTMPILRTSQEIENFKEI